MTSDAVESYLKLEPIRGELFVLNPLHQYRARLFLHWCIALKVIALYIYDFV